jgi:hypothetical protein
MRFAASLLPLADLEEVKELLGHEGITESYVHMADTALKKAARETEVVADPPRAGSRRGGLPIGRSSIGLSSRTSHFLKAPPTRVALPCTKRSAVQG